MISLKTYFYTAKNRKLWQIFIFVGNGDGKSSILECRNRLTTLQCFLDFWFISGNKVYQSLSWRSFWYTITRFAFYNQLHITFLINIQHSTTWAGIYTCNVHAFYHGRLRPNLKTAITWSIFQIFISCFISFFSV